MCGPKYALVFALILTGVAYPLYPDLLPHSRDMRATRIPLIACNAINGLQGSTWPAYEAL